MSTTTTEKTSRECALIAACAADEKKATDIMVQEVRDLIGVTDYFVIATASNNRQETREYYRLEALWNDAPVIDLAAEAGLTDIEYSDRIAKMLGKE